MNEIEIENLLSEINPQQLPAVDKSRNNDNEFTDDYLKGGNLINKLLHFSAALMPQNRLSKTEQGILTGNMVRVAKFFDTFLLLSSENRAEASLAIARIISETSIILKYLVQNINQKLSDKIVKSSLAYDKKLYQFIKKNQKKNSELYIEKRMLDSIERNFAMEGYSLEEIIYKEDKGWGPSIYDLAEKMHIPHYYETIYRSSSSAVHGTWHHLKTYYLNESSDLYEPELRKIQIRPQLIESASFVALEAAKDYTNFIIEENSLVAIFNTYIKWLSDLGCEHEKFLLKNNNKHK